MSDEKLFTYEEIIEAGPELIKLVFRLIDKEMEKGGDHWAITWGIGEMLAAPGRVWDICDTYVEWKYPGYDWEHSVENFQYDYGYLEDNSEDALYEDIYREFLGRFVIGVPKD